MLRYIITNAVMFSFLMASEQIPQVTAQWMLDQGQASSPPFSSSTSVLLASNVTEPSSIVLIQRRFSSRWRLSSTGREPAFLRRPAASRRTFRHR
jgi:hypothetical protein